MFAAHRPSRLHMQSILFCVVALICCVAVGNALAATLPADPPVVQLTPGKAPGAFHFVRQSRATFTMNGTCELIASIRDTWGDVAASMAVTDPHDFPIEADLRPGTYWISVAPKDPNNPDYWPGRSSLRIHIDKTGRLYVQDREPSDQSDFLIVKRIKGLSPDRLAIADQARPTLTWPAVPGALSYDGNLIAGLRTDSGPKGAGPDRIDPIHVTKTEFAVGHDLAADKLCIWSISAWDRNGKILAEGRAAFFGKGTKAAVVDEARAHGSTSTHPPQGGAYLGIRPTFTWVNKIPTKLPPKGVFPIPPGSDTDFIPGIQVMEVAPGSPAINAGLLPDDVIIEMNDHPVPVDPKDGFADVRAFTRQLLALAPGSQIKLKVRRFPKELIISATLGNFPGVKTGAPATP